MPEKRKNQSWICAVKVLFILAAVCLIFRNIEVKDLASLYLRTSIPIFLLIAVVRILDQAFMGVKWKILLNIFNPNIRLMGPVGAYLKGRIFAYVMPSTIGVDAYKAYYVNKRYGNMTDIIASIIVERFLGFLSSLAVILLMLKFSLEKFYSEDTVLIAYSGMAGFLFVCMIMIWSVKISSPFLERMNSRGRMNRIGRLIEALSKVKHGGSKLWIYFALSMVEKISFGTMIFLSAAAIGIWNLDFVYVVSAAPLLSLLERLPLTVASIGVREGLFFILLSPYFSDPTIAVAISLVLRSAEIFQIVAVGAVWLIGGKERAKMDGQDGSVQGAAAIDKVLSRMDGEGQIPDRARSPGTT